MEGGGCWVCVGRLDSCESPSMGPRDLRAFSEVHGGGRTSVPWRTRQHSPGATHASASPSDQDRAERVPEFSQTVAEVEPSMVARKLSGN